MDQNTREVLMFAIPTLAAMLSAYYAHRAGKKVEQTDKKIDTVSLVVADVKHQTDGLTDKLINAKAEETRLLATAAEKTAQADRETEQAKGAAAARQADAGAKASVPLTMASPPPTEGGKKT